MLPELASRVPTGRLSAHANALPVARSSAAPGPTNHDVSAALNYGMLFPLKENICVSEMSTEDERSRRGQGGQHPPAARRTDSPSSSSMSTATALQQARSMHESSVHEVLYLPYMA